MTAWRGLNPWITSFFQLSFLSRAFCCLPGRAEGTVFACCPLCNSRSGAPHFCASVWSRRAVVMQLTLRYSQTLLTNFNAARDVWLLPCREHAKMVRRRDDSPERTMMIRDRYQRISKLGEGTYGKVYKAKDTQTGAIVALKKCRLQVLNNPQAGVHLPWVHNTTVSELTPSSLFDMILRPAHLCVRSHVL